jgi:hypothetical protein
MKEDFPGEAVDIPGTVKYNKIEIPEELNRRINIDKTSSAKTNIDKTKSQ